MATAIGGNRNIPRGVVEGTPLPVNAIDGLRTAYLAEAAAASLRGKGDRAQS